jgi:8-oxo-dGTP pyrophosphatase MutT (NUDIX family)
MQHGSNRVSGFISRSVAVVGVVFALDAVGKMHVLVTKRSGSMMDEPHKLCVPCGYLDWDETTYQGMIREVYEETSLYLEKYKDFIIFDNNKKPFFIQDSPSNNRQNVSFMFVTFLDFHNAMDKFPVDISKFKTKEIEFVDWMHVHDIYNTVEDEWAFKHNDVIKHAISFYNKNLNK